MVNRDMKRCFPSLIIRECKSEPQWDTPLTAMRMPITTQNKTENSTCWRGYRESGSFVHCWWGCKMCNSWGKMDGGFSKSYRQNCRRSSNCTSRCVSRRTESRVSKGYLNRHVHSSIMHHSQEVKAAQTSPDRWSVDCHWTPQGTPTTQP